MAPRHTLKLDMLVRRMPFSAHQKMSKMLDPDSPSDWKALAGLLVNPRTNEYYTANDIDNFALELKRGKSTTEAVLKAWGTGEPTVGQLLQILLAIGREDVINEIMPGYLNQHAVVDRGAGDQNDHTAVRRNENQNLHADGHVVAYRDVHDSHADADHVHNGHVFAHQYVDDGHVVTDQDVHDDQAVADQDAHDEQAVADQDVHGGQTVADQDGKENDHELEKEVEKQNDITVGNQNREQTPDILTNFNLLKLN